MAFKSIRNDLTKMQVDVIVNTTNEAPRYSYGVDTAVYKAAGEELLLAEREKIGYLNEGDVAITPGFKLQAKYIIHAVSPRYIDGNSGEEKLLRSCYQKSLELALKYECKSIAFPLIATGSFGYPKEEGMRIAVDEIHAFLLKHEMLVYLVVFDTAATKLGLNLYPNLEAYIDHNYVCEKREEEYGDRYFGSVRMDEPEYHAYQREIDVLEEKLHYPSVCKKSRVVKDFDCFVAFYEDCFVGGCVDKREIVIDSVNNSVSVEGDDSFVIKRGGDGAIHTLGVLCGEFAVEENLAMRSPEAEVVFHHLVVFVV